MRSMDALRTITDLKPGDHLCCLYQTDEERRLLLQSFIRQGLDYGEKVILILDSPSDQRILDDLAAEGLDLEAHLASGQFSTLTVDDTYLRNGVFEPERMIAMLETETERALAEGCPALRIAGGTGWAQRGQPGSERLLEYEVKLSNFFPGRQCVALCQYDRRNFDAELLLPVLASHPVAVVGTEVFDNFYHIPPSTLLADNLPETTLDHWLKNLAARKRAEGAMQVQAQIIDQIYESVVSTDLDGYVTSWNKGAERLFGYAAEEALGRHISFVYPMDQHGFLEREVIEPLREKGNHELDVRMRRKSGEDFYAHLSLSLLRDNQQAVTGMIGYAVDITDEVHAKRALEARARQQAAVAKLGQRALAGIDLSTLMDEAVSAVAETLDVEYGKVLELLPDGEALLLRAGVGWKAGYVGHTKVKAETGSQAGYTLLSSEPVIVEDLGTETRFSGPPLLTEHGVVSGVSVIIHGQDRPFGILSAHTTQRRTFTEDSVHFLQTVANVLAEAIERKRAEQAIQQQADLLEQTHDAIVVWEFGGEILSWNKGAEDLYGWSREEAVGQVTHELLKSEHPISIQEVEAALEQQGHWEGEVIHTARDGRRVIVESRHVLARYASGSQFVLETNHDITERKRAEERLAYQAHLLANVHDAILAVDDQFTITAWNRAAERLYGWRVEEVLGRKVQEVIPSEFTDHQRAQALQALTEAGHYRAEVAQRCRDGEQVYVEGTTIALRDDSERITGYVSVNRDVTERKHAAEALQQHAERLEVLHEIDRAVLEAQSLDEIAQAALHRMRELVPCPRASVVVFDEVARAGTVMAVNTNGEARLGVGAHVPLETFGDIESFRQGKVHAVDDIQAISPVLSPIPALRAEGVRSYVNVPLIAQGELIGSLNLGSDRAGAFAPADVEIAREVADQLAIAIQQARLFGELSAAHHRLQVLSRRLVEAQETERRRIAHELHDEVGQTFTAVKINLQALQRLADEGELAPRLNASIDLVEHAVQQVRDLSLDLRPSLLDDLGLVATVRWYTDRQAQLGGFSAEVVAEPPEIRVRPELETTCFRIVQEALTNVLRYAQADHVWIELYRRAAELELIIRDDGVGFAVPAALDAAARGASLGLLGMQERARLAGGHVAIRSQSGQGTEIRARFPVTN